MTTYIACWTQVAAALFSQALAGEPELVESEPRPPTAGTFGWEWTLAGDVEGRFSVLIDGAALGSPLAGEGVDQKAGWREIVRETADAAAGELLARSGRKCQVVNFEEAVPGEARVEDGVAHAFQLRSGERAWTVMVEDGLRMREAQASVGSKPANREGDPGESAGPALSPGLELLLDVELEASLRFGSREMPLGEILDLGPGDVVELDRHVSDPVDLIVGDKIVARGEVVLVNGNFGLRVTEVAMPRKRLESIRCLF